MFLLKEKPHDRESADQQYQKYERQDLKILVDELLDRRSKEIEKPGDEEETR